MHENDGEVRSPRTKPVGLKDIAAHLQLSPATVSMVLNNAPLARTLSAETRARVLEAAKALNYRPNMLARSLCMRESRTVGVIAAEQSDGYFTRVMRGLEGALLEAGYLPFTATHLGREALIREFPSSLRQRGVDGLIFVDTPIYEEPGLPAVSVSHRCAIQGVTNVLADQREGMETAVAHLRALGHRRILMMRGESGSRDAEERHGYMLAAAKRCGVETPAELQVTLPGKEATPEVSFQLVAALLHRGLRFSAILACNDMAAIGAMRAIADAGLSCPGDVSVMGVEDISTTAFLRPRLTAAAQPLEAMGAAAVEQLLRTIRQPNAEALGELLFPMELRVRESTGPCPVTKPARARRATARVGARMGTAVTLPTVPAPPASGDAVPVARR